MLPAEDIDLQVIRNDVLMKYSGKDACVTVPDGVKAIGAHAFFLLKFLEDVKLPGSVFMIANSAFFGCADLTIRGKKGSEAERYAKEYGITFTEVSKNVF